MIKIKDLIEQTNIRDKDVWDPSDKLKLKNILNKQVGQYGHKGKLVKKSKLIKFQKAPRKGYYFFRDQDNDKLSGSLDDMQKEIKALKKYF